MELNLRSVVVYAAACGILLVVFVVWALLAFRVDVRIRTLAKPLQDGHFNWAQSELEQIADERNPQRYREVGRLDAALFRAELENEARRIIGELSKEGRSGPQVNVEEMLARGWSAASAHGLMRQLLSTLSRVDPAEHQSQRGSRLVQLRRLMDGEEAPTGYRARQALLGWPDR